MQKSLSKILGYFAVNLSYKDLPPGVIEKTKTCLIHNIGMGLAGYAIESVQTAIQIAKQLGGSKKGEATILVDGSRVGVQNAAFVNAIMINARGQDDEFHPGLIHLGSVVIPAALAIGEIRHSEGKKILSAIALGYEIAARLSKNYAVFSISRGFRCTPVYGVFGAAIAASKLLGLNESQTSNALGWAANLAGGLTQGILSKTREIQYHSGFASSNGIMAALLAEVGAETAETILEGERGFYHAFTGSRKNLRPIVEDLGDRYEMVDTFFKPYPVGGLVQTPIAVMLSMTIKHNIKPGDIAHIIVSLSPAEAQYPGVYSPKPGLLSIPYCVAVACINRKVSLATITQVDNPDVLNLMNRIKVVTDNELQPLSCKFDILIRDGRVISEEAHTTYKDYCYNMDKDIELITSLYKEMALNRARLKRIIEAIRDLEACVDISELMQISRSYRKKRQLVAYVLPPP